MNVGMHRSGAIFLVQGLAAINPKPKSPIVYEVRKYINGRLVELFYRTKIGNLLHGEYKLWFDGYFLWQYTIFDHGKQVRDTIYHVDGGIHRKTRFRNGIMVKRTQFFIEGNVEIKMHFNDHGRLISIRKWYVNGTLKASGDFTYDGVPTRYNKYYPSGQLRYSISTINGRKHGLFVKCHDISKDDVTFVIYMQGWFWHGVRHGVCTQWTKTGQCADIVEYRGGVAILATHRVFLPR